MNRKITLITGGRRGLGRNAALALARQGSGILLTYRTQEAEAAEVVAEIEKLGGQAAALWLEVGDRLASGVGRSDKDSVRCQTRLFAQPHAKVTGVAAKDVNKSEVVIGDSPSTVLLGLWWSALSI